MQLNAVTPNAASVVSAVPPDIIPALPEFSTPASAAHLAGAAYRPGDLPPRPASSSDRADPVEIEALALVLEHSRSVHTMHHFFCWTQGMMQTLVPHGLLVCALRKTESPSFQVNSFTTGQLEPSQVNHLFSQDSALVPLLLKRWENNRFQPVIVDVESEAEAAASTLGKELIHHGSGDLLVHGMVDPFGRPSSLFVFAGPSGTFGSRECHLASLLVPTLHATWVHTQLANLTPGTGAGGQTGANNLLTAREHEILGWIYRGKSNIEIGMILGISPLTVKNHVQKILRRLNVLNRAQAVGKALSLRILDVSAAR